MNTQKYVSFKRGSHKRLKRRIIAAAVAVMVALAALFVIGKLTANSEQYREKVTLVEENRALREQVADLSARVAELESIAAAPAETVNLPEEPVEEPNAGQTDQNADVPSAE
ncbi:MAG: hypothetical protein IJH94_02735 [Clostridia bacterium]|nr:hypothetical protein [Clostridia bacterium]